MTERNAGDYIQDIIDAMEAAGSFIKGMSFDDLRDITKCLEIATGFSHIVRRLPDFNGSEKGLYCRGLFCTSIDLVKYGHLIKDYIETNVFDFFIGVDDEKCLYRGLTALIEHSEDHQLFNIIMYTNTLVSEKKIIEAIKNGTGDNFMRRINIFHEWKDGLTIRVYQVIDDYKMYGSAKGTYSFIIPVFRVNHDNYDHLSKINDYEDNVLVARGLYGRIKKELKKFADSIESVAFEESSEEEAFYKMIGYDYIKMPYALKLQQFHPIAKL